MSEQSPKPEFTPSQFRNDLALFVNKRFGKRRNTHRIGLEGWTLVQLFAAARSDEKDPDAARALTIRVERLSSWYKFVKGADAPTPFEDELVAFEAENLARAVASLTDEEAQTMAEVTRAVDGFTPIRALPGARVAAVQEAASAQEL